MNILKYKMNTIDSKLDKFITNYSNDMKTLIDKLNTLNIPKSTWSLVIKN